MLSALKAYAVRVYKTVVPSKTDESILATELKFSDRSMHVDKQGFLSDVNVQAAPEPCSSAPAEANEPTVPFHTSNCDVKREQE
jgi:hypothetical protein